MTGIAAFGISAIVFFYIFVFALAIFSSIFWIVEIIDVCRRQFRDPTMKLVWLLVIIFSHFIGALIYFYIGKRDGVLPGDSQFNGGTNRLG